MRAGEEILVFWDASAIVPLCPEGIDAEWKMAQWLEDAERQRDNLLACHGSDRLHGRRLSIDCVGD